MGVGAGEVGPGISAPAGGGGPGSPGTSTLRAFPFAFDTPGLATAATLYTPTVGDILLDAWVEIDTAWDGTTPQGDVGQFLGTNAGLYARLTSASVLDMTSNDQAIGSGFPVGTLLIGEQVSRLGDLSVNTSVQAVSTVSGVNIVNRAPQALDNGNRFLPAKFTTTDPIKVCVSQDGTNVSGQAVVTSANPATVPLTVVAGVNDQFVFTGPALGVGGAGTPETFTVAPGTYSTLATLAAAMQAATGAVHPTFFNFTGSATGYEVNASGGTNLQVNAAANNFNGAGDNGDTITPGTHDFTAAAGFANPTTFGSGTGGDPGSTQGAGILYLLTATPL